MFYYTVLTSCCCCYLLFCIVLFYNKYLRFSLLLASYLKLVALSRIAMINGKYLSGKIQALSKDTIILPSSIVKYSQLFCSTETQEKE